MKKALSRQAERDRSARFLNGLSSEKLWTGFGITRLADITAFDVIGIPIWTATRPLSASISINSGKGINTMASRAGAIAEGIEFAHAENPKPIERNRTYAEMSRWRDFNLVPLTSWHLAKGAVITERSTFDWNIVASIHDLDALKFLLPSGAIYLTDSRAHLMRFQSSTNGWASGANREDAVLQALYETVERDSWTCWHNLIERHNVWPLRISLEEWLPELVAALDEQSIKPVCFDITTDTHMPSAWTVLYDLSERPAGIFSGFGTSWTYPQAVTRSVLEAVQSRACYVAGARDDLYRRSFLLMKGVEQGAGYMRAMQQPSQIDLDPQQSMPDWSAKEELAKALECLETWGFREFYVRDCGNPLEGNTFSVVKVYAPCLEQWRCGYYQPTKRLEEFASRYVSR